jgi:hypothetical protein
LKLKGKEPKKQEDPQNSQLRTRALAARRKYRYAVALDTKIRDEIWQYDDLSTHHKQILEGISIRQNAMMSANRAYHRGFQGSNTEEPCDLDALLRQHPCSMALPAG